MSNKLFKLAAYEGLYNTRYKYYPRSDGTFSLAETMVTSEPIFNPDGLERSSNDCRASGLPTSEFEKINRSKSRAKSKLYDLIMCNEFSHFCTLTLSPDEIDRSDYNIIIKKLNTYLANRVRRNGLYYVGVPELHKKGGFHFHFLVNDVLPLEDSGTCLRPAGGRPVKVDTALRQGFDLSELRTVYNITDWKLGFTTAIQLIGDRVVIANYIGKYITKGDKVGGRWYYSGGDLIRPSFKYDNIDFDTFNDYDYDFDCPNGKFLVKRFKDV